MPKLTGIALGQHADGSLELVAASVAHGSGPTMWHAQQRGPSGDWSGWQPFGKPGRGNPGTPSLGQHEQDGRIEVFVATGGDQAVWHRWTTGPGPDDWSDWESLGKPGGQGAEGPVALTFLEDGRFMAVVTAGGKVWRAASPGPEPKAHWPAWSPLGRPRGATAMAVAALDSADSRTEVALLGQPAGSAISPTGRGGKLWHRSQTGPGPDDWSDWEPLGEPGGHGAGIPVFGRDSSGGLHLFTPADVGAVWHKVQHHGSDPSWSGPWEPLAQPVLRFGETAVTADSRGRLFLVAIESASNRLWYAARDEHPPNTWSPLSPLAAVPEAPEDLAALITPTLHLDNDGRTQLFVVIRATGKLYQLTAPAKGQLPTVGRTWPHP
jgi:hypothetical protein